ncbi:uncharacterized protein BCR38DRAFT_515607, partial [Pseudomassariella vexata]
MDSSIPGVLKTHSAQMKEEVEKLVRWIQNQGTLQIILIRIGTVTEDTFDVSLDLVVSNQVKLKAKMSQMSLELSNGAGCLGNIALPKFQFHPENDGTPINITHQRVEIKNKSAIESFVASMLVQKNTVLFLKKGECNFKALGQPPSPMSYEKQISMQGMNGPCTTIISINYEGHKVSIVFKVTNASPMELTFGTCEFEMQNADSQVWAELKGRLDIRRGDFWMKLTGTLDRSVSRKGKAHLVGRRCATAGWLDGAVKCIEIEFDDVDSVPALNIESTQKDNTTVSRRSRLKFWKK